MCLKLLPLSHPHLKSLPHLSHYSFYGTCVLLSPQKGGEREGNTKGEEERMGNNTKEVGKGHEETLRLKLT